MCSLKTCTITPALRVPRVAWVWSSPTRRSRTAMSVASASKTWDGKIVTPPTKGHHFLHIDDFSREELLAMLETSREIKARLAADDQDFKPFKGKSLAMIFTKPSMRTRVSFETVCKHVYFWIIRRGGRRHLSSHIRFPYVTSS